MATEMFRTFFDKFDPQESRELLWKLLSSAACGNFNELTANEKSDLFSFYEQLSKLLSAADELIGPDQEDLRSD